MLIALVALRSSLDCFFTPAKQAALQSLTTGADRASAIGFSQAINHASKLKAPVLGGSLLALIAFLRRNAARAHCLSCHG